MKQFLLSFYSVEENLIDLYLSYWSEYSIKKKTLVSESNKTERYLYYVIKGIQKSYYLHDGKEHVMFFAYNPSFSGIVESFLTQTPSKYFLETITESTFLRIPYTKHAELIYEYKELGILFRKITEGFLLGIIERHHELLAFKVEERFKNFVKRSPHLINMIPQKDLASYLRIDSTNFSKLMNNIRI